MRRSFPAVFAALTLAVSAALLAQGTQPGQVSAPTARTPARAPDAPGTERITGKSVLRGFVVTADTGAPVRRAQVTAIADPRRRGNAVTDAEGRFEITELPAGRYRVTAMKSGFLMPGMERVGAPRGPQPTADLGEGQVLEKMVLSLTRGGVISGRITDEFGEALAGAQVSALRYQYRDGKRQLTPVFNPGTGPGTNTDDLGHFRLYGLSAGEYYVTARPPREFMMGPDATNVPSEGMAPTYFPGSPDVAQARPLQVKAGQELPNVAFALVRQRLSRVRGNALTSRGEPYVGAMIMVSGVDMMAGGGFSTGGERVRADGSFTVNGLPPGAYNLTVRTGFGPNDDAEVGNTRIVVDGSDIDGVVIAASRGGTVSGRVVTDDGSPLPRTTGLTITAMPVERGIPMTGPSQASVREDGTFEIKGLHGVRHVRFGFQGPQSQPEGWHFKGSYAGSDEITDDGLDFSGGRIVEGVEVVITRKMTAVSGRVTGADGRAITDGTVLIFPADERRWTPMSRYVRITGVTAESRFDIRDIPPHDDYRIVALPALEPGQWTDPEFLRGVLDASTRLMLGEGETKTQDLRQVRLDR